MNSERSPFLSNPFVARAARWGLLAWSAIGVLILIGVIFRFVLFPIRVIFPPLVVALIVIYLLNPIVSQLNQRRGIRRIWSTLGAYLVFLVALGLILAVLIPALTHQVTSYIRGYSALIDRADQGLADFASRLGLHIKAHDLLAAFQRGGVAYSFFTRLTSFTSGVVHAAVILILGPLIAFYLLVDLPKIRRSAETLVPARRREEIRDLAAKVNDTLGEFFRGQLLVALLLGLVSTGGYFVVGLPYFLLLGAITGLFALVPLIGIVIAAVPALFIALTAGDDTNGLLHLSGGWKLALGTAVVLVLVQQLDTRLLSPRLLGSTSRLHPVTVLLSLLVGGTLLGLWGMLLAVPVVAALRVIVLHVWDTRSSWPPRAASARVAPPGGEPPAAETAGQNAAAAPEETRGAGTISGTAEGQEHLGAPQPVATVD